MAVDAEDPAKYLVAWQTDYCAVDDFPADSGQRIFLNRFSAANGHCLTWVGPGGNTYGPKAVSGVFVYGSGTTTTNFLEVPSVAVSNDGWARVGWTAHLEVHHDLEVTQPWLSNLLLYDGFKFTDDPATWPAVIVDPLQGKDEHYPSVAISGQHAKMAAWTRVGDMPKGLIYDPVAAGDGPLRSCTSSPQDTCGTFYYRWQPVVAASGNYFIVCFGDPENPTFADSSLNVKLQLFSNNGTRVLTGEALANNPYSEPDPSDQFSPAIAFEGTDVAVCWPGRALRNDPPQSGNCPPITQFSSYNIYARRYRLNLATLTLESVVGPIVVNSDPNFEPHWLVDGLSPRPAVALSKEGTGRFIVAWTAKNKSTYPPSPIQARVRAQYFEGGRPMGLEFTVNQDNTVGPYPEDAPLQRLLGNSAQHTIAYGADDSVGCVWHSTWDKNDLPDNEYDRVYLTILPRKFADYLAGQGTIAGCKGDMNYDGQIDSADMAHFVDVFAGRNGHPCHSYVENYGRADMNSDGFVDLYDVHCFLTLTLPVSCPFNGCTTAPPQLYDCNHNQVQDAVDLTQGTSLDCNSNGMPDECDVELGADWGFYDCNSNGVPDDCDLLHGPPYFDCNNNGIPDSCDIASGYAQDCNENGVPDSCDIASGQYRDANHNGIPDGCEHPIGGDGPTQGGGDEGGGLACAPTPEDFDAAQAALDAWCAAQAWGPGSGLSGAEQYQRYVDKLCELGLIETSP